MLRRSTLGLGLLLASLAAAACTTRTVKTTLVDTPSLEVSLRKEVKGGVAVERGFAHPATISPQRLSHILGALDIELREGGKRKSQLAAIHPELIAPLSRALVDAFARADSTQEVAVKAVRKQHRLGIFHKKFLTTFTSYFKDDRLFIHLSRVEWEIPKEREDKVMPEPDRSEKQMEFRAVPARRMSQAGTQGLAIRWRDNLFSAPVRTAGETGGARRERTILMQSPIPTEELEEAETGPGLEGLDPDLLRALADLEEARRAGAITETEYQQRRENLLGESGY